jgi:hypothetical protein
VAVGREYVGEVLAAGHNSITDRLCLIGGQRRVHEARRRSCCKTMRRSRPLTSGARGTGVVEQYDGSIFCQPVRYHGIPVVEAATEVLQKQQWCPCSYLRSVCRQPDARYLDELRPYAVVCATRYVCMHENIVTYEGMGNTCQLSV